MMITTEVGAIRNGMRPIHPGEILKEEFLDPMGITANRLAEAIHVTPARLYEIISGRRGVSANTSMRLAAALGTSSEFWMNLQASYDLRTQEIAEGDFISKEIQLLPQLLEEV